MRVLAEQFRQLYNSYLQRGIFPQSWRKASLVFLRKESKDAGSSSAYRPIYLLNEMCKLFERIIANRLIQHLSRVGPNVNGI